MLCNWIFIYQLISINIVYNTEFKNFELFERLIERSEQQNEQVY